jgi:hypothetical protein
MLLGKKLRCIMRSEMLGIEARLVALCLQANYTRFVDSLGAW